MAVEFHGAADIGLDLGLIGRLEAQMERFAAAGEGGFGTGLNIQGYGNEAAAEGGAGAYLEAVVEAAHGGHGAGVGYNHGPSLNAGSLKKIKGMHTHLGAQDGVNAYVTVNQVGELYGSFFIYHFSMALRRK